MTIWFSKWAWNGDFSHVNKKGDIQFALLLGVDLRNNLLDKNGFSSNLGNIAGMHIPGSGIALNLCRRTQETNNCFRLPQGPEQIKYFFYINTFYCLFLPQPWVTDGFQLINCTLALSPVTVTTSSAEILPSGCILLENIFFKKLSVLLQIRSSERHNITGEKQTL